MQMVHLMPSSITSVAEHRLVTGIAEIISNIATDAKDPRSMQKVAGDIEALEKISDILTSKPFALSLQIIEEDQEMNGGDLEELEDESLVMCGG